MEQISAILSALIWESSSRKLKRLTDIFLALPFIVFTALIGIYVAVWRTAPLVRFTHMIWVLGFWMVGTVAMPAFIISVRLKSGASFPILFLVVIASTLAIYFTPLSRFTSLFTGKTTLILPAALGVLNVIASWRLVLCIRKKILDA